MGANAVKLYPADINLWFAAGLHGKGCKQSADRMREHLFDKYGGHYDIPMEMHIKALITTWNSTEYKGVTEGTAGTT